MGNMLNYTLAYEQKYKFMTTIINGKKIAGEIKAEIKSEIEKLNAVPGLAVVLVGADPASEVYVGYKKKACAEVGIKSFSYELPDETETNELLQLIEKLNQDNNVHGILVQLPLPKQIDEKKIIMAIDPRKDVDGFHPVTMGNLVVGNKSFTPCTPAGVIELLKRYQIEISGKDCVVIGKSNIVGKPLALLLLQAGATVTICHSRTSDLRSKTLGADILLVAVGKPNLVTADMVKPGVVLIDVGVNRLENGSLTGDVDFEAIKEKASFITPVPGGVGPMTIACLMKNCLEAYKNSLY